MHHPIFWFATALLTMFSGLLLSAYYFPGGFDWGYQVASALMSQKHNPIGGHWFAAGMCLAMLLLLPYVKTLRRDFADGGAYLRFLQVGVIFGALMGAERLFIRDLSHLLYKSHEFIALMTFLGIYIGQLGLLSRAYRQRPQLRLPVLAAALPLLGISVTLFYLYLTQRHLGWVNVSWREKGIPIWVSFAFWQWGMITFLWAGLGVLAFSRKPSNLS